MLGLVFLAYAENRFEQVREEVEANATARNPVTPADYKAKGVLHVPEVSRLSGLVDPPEGEDVGAAVDHAIVQIEATNSELRDILPRGYKKLERATLIELLRLFAPLPTQLSGDAFGFIYEDFLSNFARQEGKGGGEYFTPYSIVRLIVEIVEPYHGRVFDPACGSGGMFVQCAKFVERHNKSASRELSVFGAEKTEDTVPLAKMNLAGCVRQAHAGRPHRSAALPMSGHRRDPGIRRRRVVAVTAVARRDRAALVIGIDRQKLTLDRTARDTRPGHRIPGIVVGVIGDMQEVDLAHVQKFRLARVCVGAVGIVLVGPQMQ
ncbi:N-6 DNA methylase [Nocardia sp. R7R-8]|uniref:N-6 DNA methylase n=1 Tax=Nocardia sp. R7R-8 TaxID=3459304 RepID=UPI00403E1B39